MLYRSLILILLVFASLRGTAQQAAAIDSIKMSLESATTVEAKAYWLDNLSRTYMNVDLQEAEKYGQQLIALAEDSRQRNLMVYAYRSNGIRSSYFAGQKRYADESIKYFNRALEIARENKMDTSIGGVLLSLSEIHLAIPDKEKALNYANDAFSLISTLGSDSLLMEAHNTYGLVYLTRNERIMALRHYLNALRIADEHKPGRNERPSKKAEMLRKCYQHLSIFYSQIEAYDKAIDYAKLAYNLLDQIPGRHILYQRAIDINNIGNLFSAKKSTELAMQHYRQSIAIADSVRFATLKVPGYTSLLNEYLRNDQPEEALKFMRSSEGDALSEFLTNFGFSKIIDQAYAVIYTDMNELDSAGYYFERAKSYFETTSNTINRINFFNQLAFFYRKKGDNAKAVEYFLRVKELGESIKELNAMQSASKELDTIYRRMGNYTEAMRYNGLYYMYKDSLEKLGREKELAQVEATDEQQRLARIEREKLEAKRKRYNIQYLGITIGIAGIFVLMVMMGMFKVSATTIKLIGFFAFLMFFEFIFLLFKKNIVSVTDGEPWKDLLFMIGLAALLLPLHHWLEHKVIHYLTSHNRLTATGSGLLARWRNRKKSTSQFQE